MPTLYIILAIVAIVALWLIMTYNGLIRAKNHVDEAYSDIDVQLKRRYDLIPNLVNTVKGYATHEREAFENVTKARTAAMTAGTPAEKGVAEATLAGTLKTIFAVAEAYPELKANTNFQDLQRQLEDTEDKVAYSRQFYNSNVLDYNTKVQMFPSNIFAGMFGFKEYEFFKADEADKKKVDVKF
jgi:LemA protein